MISRTEKPWGYEELLEQNDVYVVKRLFMKAGHSCSLQYHNKKHETIYVLSGKLAVSVDDEETILLVGDAMYFDSGAAHSYRRHGRSACTAIVVVAGSSV